MILSCAPAQPEPAAAAQPEPAAAAEPEPLAAAQPEPIAAAVKATAISATVSARRRPGVNHAGLRAAAHARTPVAAAVAVAAVAMHCAHMRVSMAKPRRSATPHVHQAPAGRQGRAVHSCRGGQTARPVDALELILFCAWCFLVAVAGGAVGLVLGNIRLPAVLLLVSSPAAGAGANIGISGVAAFAAAAAHIRAGRINWRLFAWMTPPSMAGAVAGGLVSGAIPDTALLIVIGLTLFYFGVDILRKEGREAAPQRSGGAEAKRGEALDIRAAVVSGALIGLLGGLVGLILGALRMPALLRWVGEVPHKAVGTNMAVGFWVGVAGVAGHLPGGVDWAALGVGAAASVPGALLGARLTGRMSERQLLRAIGAVLVVAGAATALQAL
jgi:uncharacterized membrane protein YfcA